MQAGTADRNQYAADKPKDCVYCYFWDETNDCCMEPECYYLIPEKESVCLGCPYGRHSPCIGYCLQKIMLEMKQKKQGRAKGGGHLAG